MEFMIYTSARPIDEEMAAQLLSLMRDSFPPSERRTDEEFRVLFSHPQVQILCAREDGQLQGFLLLWVLNDFVFVENFAVQPASRGLGLGSKMLAQLTDNFSLPVILEVEPPEDELTCRRVGFYQRNGFCMNECEYFLPCLHKSIQKSIQLKIMSTPQPLSDTACRAAIEVLYHTVYEGKPIRK